MAKKKPAPKAQQPQPATTAVPPTEDVDELDLENVVVQPDEEILRRFSDARTCLYTAWPFMGFLALNMRPRVAREGDNVPTAGIALDGTVILNARFVSALSNAQLAGLIAHEVMHPALFAWERQQGRDLIVRVKNKKGQIFRYSLWNVAHDLSFNGMILEAGKNSKAIPFELPPGGAIDDPEKPQFKDMSAEEIYDKILKQAMENGPPEEGGGGDGEGMCIEIPGMDGNGIGDDMRGDLSSTPEGQRAARGDPNAQRKLETDWKVALTSAAQINERAQNGRGNLPGWLQRILTEITDPKLDWREQLSRWLGENGRRVDYTFQRPSRRSESAKEYLPCAIKLGQFADVALLMDTSGSRSDKETAEAVSEVVGICDDLGIVARAIVCDAAVHEDVEIDEAVKLAESLKGGGGSDFMPAFQRLDESQFRGVVVAFTDGDIAVPSVMPTHLAGVLWVLSKPSDHDPTNGAYGDCVWLCDQREAEAAQKKRKEERAAKAVDE